ncbi:MAG: hypothetical protein C0467_07465 [Planctomycetaceae bacterium]|nr:hypothetical protein [Planctomycetaceae bacterium]
MRVVLGCATVMALACGATFAGQAKLDGKLLGGKWEPVPEKATDKDKKDKPAAGPAIVVEFTPDAKVASEGKMTLTVTDAGKDLRVEGKYKLEANKLLVEMKMGDKDVKETLTIKKLNETELVTEDSKQKTETLRRKK